MTYKSSTSTTTAERARPRETKATRDLSSGTKTPSAVQIVAQPREFAPERADFVVKRWYRPEGSPLPQASEALSAELRLANKIAVGFPTEAVDDVIGSGLFEPAVMYELVVARRTLADRKEKHKPLTADESDRLARMLRVYVRAHEAIGDALRAHRWLRKDNRALGGKRPIDLLGSDAGTRAVEKVLGRIEHGIIS